jgi:hypothetical protein
MGDPELAGRLRSAVDGVERELAATGSPSASAAAAAAGTALPGGRPDRDAEPARPAIEPPRVRQVPYEAGSLLNGEDRDIVDAELVEETDEPGGLR